MTAPPRQPGRSSARLDERGGGPTTDRSSIAVPPRTTRRKAPLGWLPWAALAGVLLLLLLGLLLANAFDDDGAPGPADDRLGQVDDREGAGDDGQGAGDGTAGANGGGTLTEDDLARLSAASLVGGGAVAVGPAREAAGTQQLAATPGTVGTVLFAEGSAEVDDAGREVLDAAADALRESGARAVEVIGHTDQIAGEPVNDTLSQERADAVADALRERLPELEVTTSARGQDEPVAANDSEDGRQLNRRAEVVVRS